MALWRRDGSRTECEGGAERDGVHGLRRREQLQLWRRIHRRVAGDDVTAQAPMKTRRKAALPPSPWGDLAHHDAAVVPGKVLFSLLPWFSARSVLSQRGRDLFGQVVELDERESIELRKRAAP
uniref:Uncharacterized protein n=1 Tax=Oryza rufipogon TaxID=4529 RepID=A0A0E0PJY7_ORYRU